MAKTTWRFSIDVGGTFTDVVARRPDGSTVSHKVLSSGIVRGVVGDGSTPSRVVDRHRCGERADLRRGYRFRLLPSRASRPLGDGAGGGCHATTVSHSDPMSGALTLASTLATPGSARIHTGDAYELLCDEPAPVVAIRQLMGLRLDEAVGAIDVRLGTTWATNALLERRGARVALVTTKGFADALKIGHQDRPSLFKLHIHKRAELAACVVEIDERIAADGSVLRAVDHNAARDQLESLHALGITSVAICFLHAHINPEHEERVAQLAESSGFEQVSVSSRVARLEGFVSRSDTTVADAYLAPVIRAYIRTLQESLPDARLQLMTSSGGLVDAAGVSGVDTILSGPAGGVVGCAHIASRAGAPQAIGFDMGGTSTDVSRIDADADADAFEYHSETVKAGVRLRAPMLAIETVAAGGGSVCGFDGHMLTVGPRSAGADPGPACYGRGGPLTITDVNLFLGRIAASQFPFPLDRGVVETRLDELRSAIERRTGSALTQVGIARGFLSIANEHMAAAIKRVSLERGYDLRTYALVPFGGAGGQHACALADSLGMERIVCATRAGVLSAVGIAASTLRRIDQRTVQMALDAESFPRLDPVIRRLTDSVRAALLDDGASVDQLEAPHMTVDLCYHGQSTHLSTPLGAANEMRDTFIQRHHQRYGYAHTGRAINIRVVRVEMSARSQTTTPDAQTGSPRATAAVPTAYSEMIPMFLDDEAREVPLYIRRDLAVGATIIGPAVVAEETGTIVVDPGWRGVVSSSDVLTLTRCVVTTRSPSTESEAVDPIQLELFNRRFAAVAEQMGTTLRRTALSTNVKERLDFSCAVFDAHGNLVANAPHIPVHLGGMSDCIKMMTEDVGAFRVGDVYVTNDPFRGGSHLNDVTVVTPVHDESGARLLFVVASRAHHAEIGGKRPGSMAPDATSLAEEGVVIHAFPVIRHGVPQLGALRDLLSRGTFPSRAPNENVADIEAQIAANQTGVSALRALIDQHGAPVVHAYMRHIQTAAADKTRAAIARIPDGVRRFQDRLDDGTTIRLKLTIHGERARFDFTGTDGVHAGNLNANPSIVRSAVLYCLRSLIDEDVPLNGGMLEPVDIVLPVCFLNPPSHSDPSRCAAMGGGNVETSQRIVDVVFGALGIVAASQGTMNNLLLGNARFGYYETICGGSGAGPAFDGADAVHTHMTNTRLTDPEVLESRYPIRLIRFEIRADSGGAGLHHGGCGVVREMEFLERLDVSLLTQRRSAVPYGVNGGMPGAPGRNLLRRARTDRWETLGSIASITVQAGDRLVIETPGGGGWGTLVKLGDDPNGVQS